jgi:hypothetical protein
MGRVMNNFFEDIAEHYSEKKSMQYTASCAIRMYKKCNLAKDVIADVTEFTEEEIDKILKMDNPAQYIPPIRMYNKKISATLTAGNSYLNHQTNLGVEHFKKILILRLHKYNFTNEDIVFYAETPIDGVEKIINSYNFVMCDYDFGVHHLRYNKNKGDEIYIQDVFNVPAIDGILMYKIVAVMKLHLQGYSSDFIAKYIYATIDDVDGVINQIMPMLENDNNHQQQDLAT